MFDSLCMSNFCRAVYLRWNEHCEQFSASCNIEIQKKLFCINKLYKSCLMHSVCPIFAVLSIWDEINIVDSFQQVATLKYWKKLVLHKQALNHVWCTLLCPIFAVLSSWDEMNIVDSFQQVATLKYRKNFFSINKL